MFSIPELAGRGGSAALSEITNGSTPLSRSSSARLRHPHAPQSRRYAQMKFLTGSSEFQFSDAARECRWRNGHPHPSTPRGGTTFTFQRFQPQSSSEERSVRANGKGADDKSIGKPMTMEDGVWLHVPEEQYPKLDFKRQLKSSLLAPNGSDRWSILE